jgi:hypothetical protein
MRTIESPKKSYLLYIKTLKNKNGTRNKWESIIYQHWIA